MAKALMVMGTASDVGKSVIVTALCRLFARAGIRVAPFKAQNMSNNAAVCPAGGEIGRAQAVQAEACGLEPTVDMNPVLLKPENAAACQIVIRGEARFRVRGYDNTEYRAVAWREIVASYRTLAKQFDVIILEGAGGAAEINLRDRDIANWSVAKLANAPVLLVADIERGGVFAALLGTIELLTPTERARVRGLLINKFRGDFDVLQSGLRLLHERTGVPVFGALPYLQELRIPQEDAMALDRTRAPAGVRPILIGVVRLPCIANYTDFAPLEDEPDVQVYYFTDPETAPRVDLLILPGSKSTVADLRWFRQVGWENYLVRHVRDCGRVLGVCGGYQMLGRQIHDPQQIESQTEDTVGLGFLDIITDFADEKVIAQVRGYHLASGLPIAGYEIHAGRISQAQQIQPLLHLLERDGTPVHQTEGAQSRDGRIWGTAIHGLFDTPSFRRHVIDGLRIGRGLAPLPAALSANPVPQRLQDYDRFADTLAANVDIATIAALVGVSWKTGPRSL